MATFPTFDALLESEIYQSSTPDDQSKLIDGLTVQFERDFGDEMSFEQLYNARSAARFQNAGLSKDDLVGFNQLFKGGARTLEDLNGDGDRLIQEGKAGAFIAFVQDRIDLSDRQNNIGTEFQSLIGGESFAQRELIKGRPVRSRFAPNKLEVQLFGGPTGEVRTGFVSLDEDKSPNQEELRKFIQVNRDAISGKEFNQLADQIAGADVKNPLRLGLRSLARGVGQATRGAGGALNFITGQKANTLTEAGESIVRANAKSAIGKENFVIGAGEIVGDALGQLATQFATAGLSRAGSIKLFAGVGAGQAAGNAFIDSLNETGSLTRARSEASSVAATTFGLELLAGKAFSKLNEAQKPILKRFIGGGTSEGLTEFTQTVAELVAQDVFRGKDESELKAVAADMVDALANLDFNRLNENELWQATIGGFGAGGIASSLGGGGILEAPRLDSGQSVQPQSATQAPPLLQAAEQRQSQAEETQLTETVTERNIPQEILQQREKDTPEKFRAPQHETNFNNKTQRLQNAAAVVEDPNASEEAKALSQEILDKEFTKLTKEGKLDPLEETQTQQEDAQENEDNEQGGRTPSEQEASRVSSRQPIDQPSSDQESRQEIAQGREDAVHQVEEATQSQERFEEAVNERVEFQPRPSEQLDIEILAVQNLDPTPENLDYLSNLILERNAAAAAEEIGQTATDAIVAEMNEIQSRIQENIETLSEQEAVQANQELINRQQELGSIRAAAIDEIQIRESTKFDSDFGQIIAPHLPDQSTENIGIVGQAINDALAQIQPSRPQVTIKQVREAVEKTLAGQLGGFFNGIKDRIGNIILEVIRKIGAIKNFAIQKINQINNQLPPRNTAANLEAVETLNNFLKAEGSTEVEIVEGNIRSLSNSFIKAFESTTGKTIIPVRQKEGKPEFAGVAIPGDSKNIFYNVEGKRRGEAVVGHEFIHVLRNQNPELYKQFGQAIISASKGGGVQGSVDLSFYLNPNLPLKEQADIIQEEGFANIAGDLILNPSVLRALKKTDATGFNKIARKLIDFIDLLLSRFRRSEWGSLDAISDLSSAGRALLNAMENVGLEPNVKELTKAFSEKLKFAIDPNEGAEQVQEANQSIPEDLDQSVIPRTSEELLSTFIPQPVPAPVSEAIVKNNSGLGRLLPSRPALAKIGLDRVGAIKERIAGRHKEEILDPQSADLRQLSNELEFAEGHGDNVALRVEDSLDLFKESDQFGNVTDFIPGESIGHSDLIEAWSKQGRKDFVTVNGETFQLTEKQLEQLTIAKEVSNQITDQAKQFGVLGETFEDVTDQTPEEAQKNYSPRGTPKLLRRKAGTNDDFIVDDSTSISAVVSRSRPIGKKRGFQKERSIESQKDGTTPFTATDPSDNTEYEYVLSYPGFSEAIGQLARDVHVNIYLDQYLEKAPTKPGKTTLLNSGDFYNPDIHTNLPTKLAKTGAFANVGFTTKPAARTFDNLFNNAKPKGTSKSVQNLAGGLKAIVATVDTSVLFIQQLIPNLYLASTGALDLAVNPQRGAAKFNALRKNVQNVFATLVHPESAARYLNDPGHRHIVEKYRALGRPLETLFSDEMQAFTDQGIATKLKRYLDSKKLKAGSAFLGGLQRFNASFNAGLVTAAIELGKLNHDSNGDLVTDEMLIQFHDRMLGLSRMGRLGLSQGQRALESVMFFSAMMTRASVDVLATAMNPKDPNFKKTWKMAGSAYLALGAFQVVMQGLLSRLGLSDEDEGDAFQRLNPFDKEFRSIFRLTFKDSSGNNRVISLGGGVTALLRRIAGGLVGVTNPRLDQNAGETLATEGSKFLRSKLSPLAGGVVDQVIGEDFLGRRLPETAAGRIGWFAQHNLLPISIQDSFESGDYETSVTDKFLDGVVNFAGVNTFIENPSAIENRMMEDAAKKLGYSKLQDVPLIEKARIQDQFKKKNEARENLRVPSIASNEFKRKAKEKARSGIFFKDRVIETQSQFGKKAPSEVVSEFDTLSVKPPSFSSTQNVFVPNLGIVEYTMMDDDIQQMRDQQREAISQKVLQLVNNPDYAAMGKDARVEILNFWITHITDQVRRRLGYIPANDIRGIKIRRFDQLQPTGTD